MHHCWTLWVCLGKGHTCVFRYLRVRTVGHVKGYRVLCFGTREKSIFQRIA